LYNGNPLPTWLSFDAATRTFTGTPTEVGEINIKVIATDAEQQSIFGSFYLTMISPNVPADSLYFGQTRPGGIPQLFAPNIISTPGRLEKVITFSPNGKEVFFATGNWPNCVAMYMTYRNGAWSTPVPASFSTDKSADEPIFSPDGSRVYYYAYNAPNSLGGSDICFSEMQNGVWGTSVNLGEPVNSAADEYHPCVVNDCSIYISNTSGQICRSQYSNNAYGELVKLPSFVNDATSSYRVAYVVKDESYIIFNSNISGGIGGLDHYICYKKADGTWTYRKNLGNKINTSISEGGGDITPDGMYMTFTRNSDIYWVSTSFIDSLRNTNFVPYVNNSISDRTDTVGRQMNFTVPADIFIDDDGNNTLTFAATLENGNALPAWLTFNASTRTFSGIPSEFTSLNIKVTATDASLVSVSANFRLNTVFADAINQFETQNVSIYPNPTKDKITITFDSKQFQTASILLIDVSGKALLSNTYNNTSSAVINLSSYPKGVYILKIVVDGTVCHKKVFVE